MRKKINYVRTRYNLREHSYSLLFVVAFAIVLVFVFGNWLLLLLRMLRMLRVLRMLRMLLLRMWVLRMRLLRKRLLNWRRRWWGRDRRG